MTVVDVVIRLSMIIRQEATNESSRAGIVENCPTLQIMGLTMPQDLWETRDGIEVPCIGGCKCAGVVGCNTAALGNPGALKCAHVFEETN